MKSLIFLAIFGLSGCVGVTARVGGFHVSDQEVTPNIICIPICLEFDYANLNYAGIGLYAYDQPPYIGLIYWGER